MYGCLLSLPCANFLKRNIGCGKDYINYVQYRNEFVTNVLLYYLLKTTMSIYTPFWSSLVIKKKQYSCCGNKLNHLIFLRKFKNNYLLNVILTN